MHDAGLHAGVLRKVRQLERFLKRLGRGLLGVDRLACGDGLADSGCPRLRDEEVSVDLPLLIGQCRIEIGGVVLDAMEGCEFGELLLVTADKDRLHRDAGAVGQLDAALITDSQDRPHQVLPIPHASGDAVHDDADLACCRL